MLICCHRGYHADVPENTLAAFEQAVNLGFDGIETDVRVSSDGQAILYHNRLAPDGREVSRLNRSELSAVVGFPVPTLEQSLDRWASVLWILEIKRPEALTAAFDILRRFAPTRRLLVISFWHSVIEQTSRLHDVQCGLLLSHQPSSLKSFRKAVPRRPGKIDSIVWNYEFLDVELLRDAAARGYRNFVYGPESRAEHDHCARLNLTGIITDYPQMLVPKETAAAGDPPIDVADAIQPL